MTTWPFIIIAACGTVVGGFLSHRVGKKRGKLMARIEKELDVNLGEMPPVPWLLAAIFLLLPLAALVMAAPKLAIAVIVLQILAPVAFARLDRG